MNKSTAATAADDGPQQGNQYRDNRSAAQLRPKLSLFARLYIGTVISIGLSIVAWQSATAVSIANLPQFIVYTICAALASRLKVRLPGIDATMSVNFLFILMAIVDLSSGEAVWVAAFSIVVQNLWCSHKRATAVQAAFNIASVATSTFAGAALFHAAWVRSLGLEDGILLLLTASVYFVCNTFTIAVVISLTEGKPIVPIWTDCYFWSYPYYLVGAAVVFTIRAITTAFGWQTGVVTLPVVYAIYRSYRLYLDRLAGEKQHADEMAALHLRTIKALALAIEAKDHTTNEHLHRVQVYALGIAEKLGLSESETRALEAASLLHDIGKLAVPEHIISKPGKLTAEEFEKMKTHPVIGAEILERVQFPYPVVPIVAAHHEKWNGTGYPHGLAGENIPIGARILSVVDCLDALASDRQYRRALPLEEAMSIIKAQSGTAFEPRIVDVLERNLGELERRARAAEVETMTLSTDISIAPGAAPGAGLADEQQLPAASASVQDRGDFLASIAAARNEVQILFELAQSLGTSLSLVDTLSVVAQRLQTIIPYDALAIYLQRDGKLRPEYVTGSDAAAFGSLSIPVGHGLSGWVLENGKPIVNGCPNIEWGYLQNPVERTLQSALVVPLDGVAGRIGTLALYHRAAQGFRTDHLRILLAVSAKLGRSIENSLRFRQAENSAVTDFLTGLPNGRSLFMHIQEEVERCSAANIPLTLLVCDLDGFKQVNDDYGHLEGNRMLRLTADALKEHCRTGDYIGRMGGDEFVIVMPGTPMACAAQIIERIQDAVKKVSRTNLGRVVFSVSVGAAELGADCSRAEDLLAAADRKMYLVKRSRKCAIPFGDSTVVTNAQRV